jgi:hypothetical protein
MTTTDAAFSDLYAAATAPTVDWDTYAFPYIDTAVLLDDGRRFVGHADHRDMRRAHMLIPAGGAVDPLGFNMATAYAYLSRTGALGEMTWKEFAAACCFAAPLEQQTAADPTRTATD